MVVKDGFDGAGSQTQIHSKEVAHITQAGVRMDHLELMGYIPMEIQDHSPHRSKPVSLWKEAVTNSSNNFRPLCLIAGKEDYQMVKRIYDRYPVKQDPFPVSITTKSSTPRTITVKIDIHRSMCDGKARKIISGRLGSWCPDCNMSSEDIHTASKLRRPIVMKFAHFEDLEKACDDTKIGGDIDLDLPSKARHGFTENPLGKPQGMAVLHAAMNTARWILDKIAKAEACVEGGEKELKMLSEMRDGFTGENAKRVKDSQDKFAARVLEATNGEVDVKRQIGYSQTGDGLIGEKAKTLLKKGETVCNVMTNKTAVADKMKPVVENLYKITSFLGSRDRTNPEDYFKLCRDTHILILESLPWARISPTVHQILDHSWEWVLWNNGQGLCDWAEDGLEAMQKTTRNTRNLHAYRGK